MGSRPRLQTINFIKKVISKSVVFHPGQGGGLAEPFSPVNKPLPPVNKSRGSGGVAAARFLLGPQLIDIPEGARETTKTLIGPESAVQDARQRQTQSHLRQHGNGVFSSHGARTLGYALVRMLILEPAWPN